jgi:hypothetical protein
MGDYVCCEPRHSFLRYVAWLAECMLVILYLTSRQVLMFSSKAILLPRDF